MATESIRISAVIPASPSEIYSAWLDGEKHEELTGGGEASVEAHVGGRHTAWDGYIEGQILELEAPSRIVQSWRSLDFPPGSADSRLEILLTEVRGGAEITLVHTEIPEGQSADYEEGWVEHYFKPMRQFFGKRAPNGIAPDHATPRAVEAASAPRSKAKKKVKSSKAKPAPKKAAPKRVAAKKAAPKKTAAKKTAAKKAAPKKTKKPAPKKRR